MCIRDSAGVEDVVDVGLRDQGITQQDRLAVAHHHVHPAQVCLLYTSDAADERSSVDLGGRRIIKKKKTQTDVSRTTMNNTIKNTSHTLCIK